MRLAAVIIDARRMQYCVPGFMRLLCAVAVGAALALACTTGQRGPAPAPSPAVAPGEQPRALSVRHYVVDSSHLGILVYRDGPMARMGHNHVLSSTKLGGEIELAEPLAATRFFLRLPLDSLEVDLPEERAAAGADFSAPVADQDRAGTRRNMLGASQLDAERYPVLTLESSGLSGGPEEWIARVRVTLHGEQREIDVPLRLTNSPEGLETQGRVTVDHAVLGLTPFSVGLGALRVRPDITIDFRLRAQPADPPRGGT